MTHGAQVPTPGLSGGLPGRERHASSGPAGRSAGTWSPAGSFDPQGWRPRAKPGSTLMTDSDGSPSLAGRWWAAIRWPAIQRDVAEGRTRGAVKPVRATGGLRVIVDDGRAEHPGHDSPAKDLRAARRAYRRPGPRRPRSVSPEDRTARPGENERCVAWRPLRLVRWHDGWRVVSKRGGALLCRDPQPWRTGACSTRSVAGQRAAPL